MQNDNAMANNNNNNNNNQSMRRFNNDNSDDNTRNSTSSTTRKQSNNHQRFKINGIFILTLFSSIVSIIFYSTLSFGCQNFQVVLPRTVTVNNSTTTEDNDNNISFRHTLYYRYGYWSEYNYNTNTCINFYDDNETDNLIMKNDYDVNDTVLILGRVFGTIGFILSLLYIGYLCNEEHFKWCQPIKPKERLYVTLIPFVLSLISFLLLVISRRTYICQYNNQCSYTRRGQSGFAAVIFWFITMIGEFYLGWKTQKKSNPTSSSQTSSSSSSSSAVTNNERPMTTKIARSLSSSSSSSSTMRHRQSSNSRIYPNQNIAHSKRSHTTTNPNIPNIDNDTYNDNDYDDDYIDEEVGNYDAYDGSGSKSIESVSIQQHPPRNPDYNSAEQSTMNTDNDNLNQSTNTNNLVRQSTDNVSVATTLSEKTGLPNDSNMMNIYNNSSSRNSLVKETIHFPDGTSKKIITHTIKQDDGSIYIERNVIVMRDNVDDTSNLNEGTMSQPNHSMMMAALSDIDKHDYPVIPPANNNNNNNNNNNSTIVETIIQPDGSKKKTTTKTVIDDDGNVLVDRTVDLSSKVSSSG